MKTQKYTNLMQKEGGEQRQQEQNRTEQEQNGTEQRTETTRL